MAFLSKTRAAELRAQLKFFENLTRNAPMSEAERVAIGNYRMAICDLLCIDGGIDGCYMDDLRHAPRTAHKFGRPFNI